MLGPAQFETLFGFGGGNSLGVCFSRDDVVFLLNGSREIIQRYNQYKEWHHVAVTIDNTKNEAKIYADGDLKKSSFIGFPIQISILNSLVLGKIDRDEYPIFKGKMDELRIWTTARTQGEIQANMNSELAGDEPDLLAYYTFNQGLVDGDNTLDIPRNNTLLNNTTNSNNGLLSGFVLNGKGSNWTTGSPTNHADKNNDGIGDSCDPTVVDIEGNSYKTVQIGNQIWMAEDLRTTKCNDGSSIPLVENNTEWSNLNWYAVSVSNCNICPEGWHVPSDAEWTTLIDYIDPTNVDPNAEGIQGDIWGYTGRKMKKDGIEGWAAKRGGPINESGFSGMPGGRRDNLNGMFFKIGVSGAWWSSSEIGPHGWYRRLKYYSNDVSRSSFWKKRGLSVRCIKD